MHDALSDLRRTRRARRLGDAEWFDLAYRVYIAAIFGGSAVIVLSDQVGDAEATPSQIASVFRDGPAVLGMVAVLAAALGLRSGSDGGPLSIEAADVRLLLLAPIERRSVLTRPLVQRLRSAAFTASIVGGIGGVLAAQRLPGSAAAWTAERRAGRRARRPRVRRRGDDHPCAAGIAPGRHRAGDRARRVAGRRHCWRCHRSRRRVREYGALGLRPAIRRSRGGRRHARARRHRLAPRRSTPGRAARPPRRSGVATAVRGHDAGPPDRGAPAPPAPQRTSTSDPMARPPPGSWIGPRRDLAKELARHRPHARRSTGSDGGSRRLDRPGGGRRGARHHAGVRRHGHPAVPDRPGGGRTALAGDRPAGAHRRVTGRPRLAARQPARRLGRHARAVRRTRRRGRRGDRARCRGRRVHARIPDRSARHGRSRREHRS